MLMRCARRSLPLLLAPALALTMSVGLTACTSEPGDAPPTPVAATPSPTLVPSPSPAADGHTNANAHRDALAGTDAIADAHTRAHRDAFADSHGDAHTNRDALANAYADGNAPAPTPTATPAPLITAEDLGIREVDTAEALAAAGLTHVRYAAGEEVPWDPGLFLLGVSTGAVEGWVRSLAALPEEERGTAWNVSDNLYVSPSNRFVSWAGHGVLHDRQTGRTYALDRGSIEFDRWWGTGPGRASAFPPREFRGLRGDGCRDAARGAVHAPARRAFHQPQRRLHPRTRVRRV